MTWAEFQARMAKSMPEAVAPKAEAISPVIALMEADFPLMRRHLADVGCASPDAAMLTMSVWCGTPIENGLEGREYLAFLAVYAAACKYLGVQPDPTDIKPLNQRTPFEKGELTARYQAVVKAKDLRIGDMLREVGSRQPPDTAAQASGEQP